MTKKKGGGFPRPLPEPNREFRDQEAVEPTDTVKSASSASGLKIHRGWFGLPRRASLWLAAGVRFRIRRKNF